MLFSLLLTKLHRPLPPPHQVQRPHLLARLNQGLYLEHKLTLVVAPAGFGKTTLLSQWIDDLRAQRASALDAAPQEASSPERANRQSKIVKSCWLSLDADDNDLARFLQYVIAALQTVFPAACANALSLLQTPQLPPVPYLATTLLNDLAALDQTQPGQACILVLEDYHCITEAAIHQLLTRLLDHLPRQIHLVLISRTDPPLPLGRLRVQQQIIEIRAADLCFSLAETQTLLTQTLGKNPEQATVITLQAQTEGWVAGLQLAAISLRGRANESDFVAAFAGTNRHVMEYLVEEVLARQPQAIQSFLVRTSIFDRFCAPLCEAVLAIGDRRAEIGPRQSQLPSTHDPSSSQQILSHLAQANLFVVRLDEQGDWVRYHHLFRDLLRHHLQARLSTNEIAALHRQASIWLASAGLIEAALEHALAAGDALLAAQWFEQHRHALIDRADFSTLKRWLARLPEELVQQQPALLLTRAWVANAQHQIALVFALAQQAEAALAGVEPGLDEQATQSLRGEIDTLYSIVWFRRGEGQPLLLAARQALARLPATHSFMVGTATLGVGFGYLLTGQPQTAVRFWQETLEHQPLQTDLFRIRLLFPLGGLHLIAGHLHQSLALLQECLQLAAANQITYDAGWAYYLVGVIHYHWNDLAAATHYFSTLVELVHHAPVSAVIDGLLGLALIHQVRGQPTSAQALVTRAAELVTELRLDNVQPEIHSFQARLFLLQGNIAAAAREMELSNLSTPLGIMYAIEVPRLTQARVLVAQVDPVARQAAWEILQALWPAAEALDNVWRMIEILTLETLLHQTQGQTEQALATLTRAVKLAKPGRFIRTFVDLGAPLAGLLYQLAAGVVETDYLGQVLAAFPSTPGADALTQRARQAAQAHLIEPLTERELEVLALLAQRFSNQEIAQALTISPLTVRTHTTNLYQKLGVNSRKQAVAQARTLGLLAADDD